MKSFKSHRGCKGVTVNSHTEQDKFYWPAKLFKVLEKRAREN